MLIFIIIGVIVIIHITPRCDMYDVKYIDPKNVKLDPAFKDSIEHKQLKVRQKKLNDMLKDFISVCDKNNIDYFVISGTLIGALRHKDWIPFDDDIDIGMLEVDFNKLMNIKSEASPLSQYDFIKINSIASYFIPWESLYKIIPKDDQNIHQVLDIFILKQIESDPNYYTFHKPKCNMFFKHKNFCNYPYKTHISNVLPTKSHKFANLTIKVPNKPIKFLEETDGHMNISILPPINKRTPRHTSSMLKYVPNIYYTV